jgi:hypothetical protein
MVVKVGAQNPFDEVQKDHDVKSTIFCVDLTGDNKKDCVVGNSDGNLRYFLNTGTEANPFQGTEQTGTANPFQHICTPGCQSGCGGCALVLSTLWCGDLDNDGDADCLTGSFTGPITYGQAKLGMIGYHHSYHTPLTIFSKLQNL